MIVRLSSHLHAGLRLRGLSAPRPAFGWAPAGAAPRVPDTLGTATFARAARRALLGRVRGTEGGRPSGRFLRALRRREREALDEVYETYASTVLGYLINVVGDRGTAEDVHQQVFLEVWQRAPTYDAERAGILTWILTIARTRAIDELRRRVPEPRDPAVSPALALAPDEDPERSPETLLERWRVAHLLSRLRAEEAQLLRMRFYEELSQGEIAERTGIPLGTVKMRMVSALETLRGLLEEDSA
jgi:RNA polymerase sigma-70 factor, ECF subfamily